MIRRALAFAVLAVAAILSSRAAARSADILLDPASQTVSIGAIVEVRIELSGSDGQPQQFDVVDVIFSWDPTVLDLIEASQVGADYVFFVSGFLPNPDGINTNLDDGLAMFTGLGPPGAPQTAPPSPQMKTVTTLRFQAIARTPGTVVDIVPAFGMFSTSRVLLKGANVTGDINSMAMVTVITPVPCPGADSCFVPHETPACDDAGCCEVVCAGDPACCAEAWDALCVAHAFDLCDGCGDPGAGDCCAEHGTPFCDEQACCEVVCAVVPDCCELTWDALCVAEATMQPACGCDPCAGATGNCFCAHASAGCEDAECCTQVCDADPNCCDLGWDQACADAAGAACTCRFDFDGNGIVDGADLGLLLSEWGSAACPYDANGDAGVDGADLGLLLAEWGPCG